MTNKFTKKTSINIASNRQIMKQNLESSFNLGNTTLLTQHFHSTLREKHVIYTLIYVRKFN